MQYLSEAVDLNAAGRFEQKKGILVTRIPFGILLVYELAQALLVTWRRRAKNPKATRFVLAARMPRRDR